MGIQFQCQEMTAAKQLELMLFEFDSKNMC